MTSLTYSVEVPLPRIAWNGGKGRFRAKDVPVALTEIPMAFNQDMKAVVPHDGVSPEFLLYALDLNKRALFQQIGTSAHGTRRLSSSSVEALVLGLPPQGEQARIAEALLAVDRKIKAEENHKQALEVLFKTLLHDLMTGSVRVAE